jgi:hypothetical protein
VRTVLIIVAALVLIRIALPYVILHFANQRLEKMPGYYGHVEDIDLALIRGAYRIDGFFLDKQDSVTLKRTPFMAADVIDLSVEWKALFPRVHRGRAGYRTDRKCASRSIRSSPRRCRRTRLISARCCTISCRSRSTV